jgi:methylamine dehydrogenase accessory protein MauD
MTEALVVSNIILWIVVLALLLAVLALARQVGILYERVAPMGALMLDHGPKVGDMSPVFNLESLGGGSLSVGWAGTNKSQLLFFLSPTCPVCKKLLPVLKSIRSVEAKWLDVVLASDGDRPEHAEFYRKAGLSEFPYVSVDRSRHGLSGGQTALRHIDRGGWPDSRQGPGQLEGAARKPLRRQGTGRRFGTGIH